MEGAVEAANASPPAKRPRRSGRAIKSSAARSSGAVGQAASDDEPQNTGSGRGRRRKRRRVVEPEPPPPLPVDEPDPCDSADGNQMEFEHGNEAQDEDDADDEAAALSAAIAAAAAAAAAAPKLSIHEQAVRLLMQSTGVPRERALLALEESKAEAEPQDAYDWQELAQIWLAERADFEDERDLLAETMRVSLEEAELRRAAQKPLVECSADEIQQTFATSDLLRRLAERRSLPSLLQPPLREPLLSYLELEKKCKRWYDVACHFFSAAAEQLAAQLACGEAEQKGAEAGVTGELGAPPVSGALDVAEPLPADEEEAAVLAVTLECRREEIQAAVFAMPQGDGLGLPALFAAAVPEGANQVVVDLQSEDEAGLERQAAGDAGTHPPAPQQQQQQQEQGG